MHAITFQRLVSRKDEIFISESGLISIAGGKLTGYRKMAHRVIDTVLKTMPQKRKEKLEEKLIGLGINDSYYATHLCSTFGKKANTIIERIDYFADGNPEERLIRAELWYCIHNEMTNSLADFFVRRTGRLYFNIDSIHNHLEVILKDCINYLDWDEQRISLERETMQMLLDDATIYYDVEF